MNRTVEYSRSTPGHFHNRCKTFTPLTPGPSSYLTGFFCRTFSITTSVRSETGCKSLHRVEVRFLVLGLNQDLRSDTQPSFSPLSTPTLTTNSRVTPRRHITTSFLQTEVTHPIPLTFTDHPVGTEGDVLDLITGRVPFSVTVEK